MIEPISIESKILSISKCGAHFKMQTIDFLTIQSNSIINYEKPNPYRKFTAKENSVVSIRTERKKISSFISYLWRKSLTFIHLNSYSIKKKFILSTQMEQTILL